MCKSDKVKVTVLFVAVLGVAGCGMGNSNPPSHMVKRFAAEKMYTQLLQYDRARLQVEAPHGGTPSASYLKHKAHYDKMLRHRNRSIHSIEAEMHGKGCTKTGDATYNCSVILDNPVKGIAKMPLIVTVDQAGQSWSPAGIKMGDIRMRDASNRRQAGPA
ncbi:MAG: hypothetical protein ACYCS8_11485 [Acidithiobacillus sp.]